ncbi:MAG TPA: lysine-2,3-aminomutase-like protein [Stellaceae bacterium]|jgi:lysine 2,3-aminomutase|nr:lysine-2,3-aminomutase-like protein [Stellaceae bacterium]
MASDAMRDGDALIAAGLLSPDSRSDIDAVAARYAVAVTPDVAALIERDDPGDPLARQYLPRAEELHDTPEERADPIGDRRHSPVKGIVHRYPDRVLLTPHHACAVYCRFCFRRAAVGPGGDALTPTELDTALDYIRSKSVIWEVILTGGDPLLLSPRRLGDLIAALAAIDHVAVIRIHSRVPMAEPGRVTTALLNALATDKALWLAVHANHANEFGPPQRQALARLVRAGVPLLGQTVLLRGVNDDAAVLETLFRTMVANRVKPYYLHHPDLARGTSHFRLDIAEGLDLTARLRGRVSGLCQPTYVLDIPGGYGKVPLTTGCATAEGGAGRWLIRDSTGRSHSYPPAAEPGEK